MPKDLYIEKKPSFKATRLYSIAIISAILLISGHLAGCQQNSSTDDINTNAKTEPSIATEYSESNNQLNTQTHPESTTSALHALAKDSATVQLDTQIDSQLDSNLSDKSESDPPINANQVTFHTRPLDYELPKQVAKRCVNEPKEGEIRCPEVNVSLAEVEPKWIEQVINLDITNDNSPQRAKFNQELDEFTTSQITDEMPMSYYMQITPEQEASHKNVAQFSVFRDVYMGGAHGMPTKYYLLFDMDLQSQIDLADVITDEEAFYELAYVAFRSYLEKNVGLTTQEEIEDYEQFWTFVLPQSFYFNDTGVVLMYQPYEIGSYAQGFIELTVAYDNLQGILKPKYMP